MQVPRLITAAEAAGVTDNIILAARRDAARGLLEDALERSDFKQVASSV